MSRSYCGLLTAGLLFVGAALAQEPLALAEAERLALERDPVAQQFGARAEAMRSQAVAAGQLPDPKLRFGVENLPTDSFALDAEPMTQLSIGLVQEFPRGRSRALRTEQSLAQAGGEEARGAERRLETLRAVRRAWLDAWYREQALDAVRASREIFGNAVSVTEAQYAAGRDTQQTMLQARVELARMADRESEEQAALESARAELSRWIADDARRPLARGELGLPAVAPLASLSERLPGHPALGGDGAEILAAEKEAELARQEYRPGFAFDLSYGKRFGTEEGAARSDMVTAMIEMEVPLFPGKRQDQRVAASRRLADATRYARDDRLRELRSRLEGAYALWLRLGERLERYRRDVVPQAALNATAADHAYRNRTASFDVLVRARLSDLDARLEALRLETEEGQARAELAYFQADAAGERP